MPNWGRLLLLTLGPFALIAGSYLIASPRAAGSSTLTGGIFRDLPDLPAELHDACQQMAAKTRERFGEPLEVLTKPPFVLATDATQAELHQQFEQIIEPIAQTLAAMYFDNEPTQPVTIVLLTRTDRYRAWLKGVSTAARTEYSGIYLRDQRLVVLDASTGAGTLAHELTHALCQFDAPLLPEWLDEGLASLHEESEFSTDGLLLLGLDNWRQPILAQAIENGRYRGLRSLLSEPFAQTRLAPVDYAAARYLCLWLQEQQLLGPFYRKCRQRLETLSAAEAASSEAQRTAEAQRLVAAALCQVQQVGSLEEVDTRFVAWFRSRERVGTKSATRGANAPTTP